MEQLGRHVAEWRAIILDKVLKENAGKSKVMIGSSGRKMIEKSSKSPHGVYGTIQKADLAGVLVVDGEMYGCVKSFCYLGDGGADLATTARIRSGWMKFQEPLPFLTSKAPPLEMKGRMYASCVRNSMTYGSETRPMPADVGLKFERAEMQMMRWMCGVSLKDRTCEELRKLVQPITSVIRSGMVM